MTNERCLRGVDNYTTVRLLLPKIYVWLDNCTVVIGFCENRHTCLIHRSMNV